LLKTEKGESPKADRQDPIEAIKLSLERTGRSRKDLEVILNAGRGRVWDILARRRPLTLTMIRKLHKELGISADILIREYDVDLHKR
jgi:HTH-type transcriptional regulator / antitoxin HigA